jgi:hypothetical protein
VQAEALTPIDFRCPACGALPADPCKGIDGLPMPSSHSKRKELIFALVSPKSVRLEFPRRPTD